MPTASNILPHILEVLRDLIAFRSESAKSNLDMIEYLERVAEKYSLSAQKYFNKNKTKANLLITIPGYKGEIEGGILLSGHSDVVPADQDDWRYHPYSLHREKNRLYGRGTCDMKGFLAVVVAMIPQFLKIKLKDPIHLAFTYDEEIGCLGGQVLAKELKKWKTKPETVIVGEPTDLQVITAHKSCCEYKTIFKGLAGHGSNPGLGVNAVEYASRYINYLMDLREQLKLRVSTISNYDPPHSTLQIGKIQGGSSFNVIADYCEVDWELRTINRSDFDFIHENINQYVKKELTPLMRKVYGDAQIVKETIGEVQGLVDRKISKTRDMLLDILGLNKATSVSFGTEAGLFQSLGASVVVCGPGSIKQAHKSNEYIELSQLNDCINMLLKLGNYYEYTNPRKLNKNK